MKHFLQKLAATLVAFGPWGVLILAVVDSMGIPLPAATDAVLIGVAVESAMHPGHAYFTALMAIVGSLAGNIFLFQMARQGRRMFSSREEPSPGKRQRFQEWFSRYGLLTVFIPAVTPVLPLPLKVFVISAGAFHTPFGRFLIVILVARVIRYIGLAYLGLQLGADAQGFLQRNGWTLTGIALLMAFALFWLMRLSDRRRSAERTI
jgi:membrane protein YqaA with SNARE-associated domain